MKVHRFKAHEDLVFLQPESLEEFQFLDGYPFVVRDGNTFSAYWSHLDDISARVAVVHEVPGDLGSDYPARRAAFRSDLKHLPLEWNRDRIRAFFTPAFKPRDYQVDGIFSLMTRRRSILADDAGLGKTLQSAGAAVIDCFADPNAKGTIVVICPSGLRFQWRTEVTGMFVVPGTDEPLFNYGAVTVIDGEPKQRARDYSRPPAKWTIVSYEILIRDHRKITPWLREHGVRTAIIDESSRVKNPASVSWGAVRTVTDMASRQVFLLNATPLENGVGDLWAQMRLVDQRIFPTAAGFQSRYVKVLRLFHCRKCGKFSPKPDHRRECQATGKFKYAPDIVKPVDCLDPESLRRVIRDRYVRRTYGEVQEQLPELLTAVREVELGDKQRAAYEAVKESEHDARAKIEILSTAALFFHDGAHIHSAKLDALVEILEQVGDEKVVIVTESKVLAIEARRRFAPSFKTAIIHGDVPDTERDVIVREFVKGRTQILFGTSAIERGLNLQVAGWMVMLDLPWNPARWIQRVGRIRRIGARHASVRVLNLVARGTVEASIFRACYQKQGVFNSVFDESVSESTFAVRVPLEDILKEPS